MTPGRTARLGELADAEARPLDGSLVREVHGHAVADVDVNHQWLGDALGLGQAAFDVITYAAVIEPVTLVLVPSLPDVPCMLFGTSTALMANGLGDRPCRARIARVGRGRRPRAGDSRLHVRARRLGLLRQGLQTGRALRQHSHDAPGTLTESTSDAVVVQVVTGLLADTTGATVEDQRVALGHTAVDGVGDPAVHLAGRGCVARFST